MRDMNYASIHEIDQKISNLYVECEMIIELMDMPKYFNSKSLSDRFKETKARIELLIIEKEKHKVLHMITDNLVKVNG